MHHADIKNDQNTCRSGCHHYAFIKEKVSTGPETNFTVKFFCFLSLLEKKLLCTTALGMSSIIRTMQLVIPIGVFNEHHQLQSFAGLEWRESNFVRELSLGEFLEK